MILGSRDLDKGKKAIEKLATEGINADLIQYDAFDLKAPQKVYDYISKEYKKLDILINNAGVLLTGNLFIKIVLALVIKISRIHFKLIFSVIY